MELCTLHTQFEVKKEKKSANGELNRAQNTNVVHRACRYVISKYILRVLCMVSQHLVSWEQVDLDAMHKIVKSFGIWNGSSVRTQNQKRTIFEFEWITKVKNNNVCVALVSS